MKNLSRRNPSEPARRAAKGFGSKSKALFLASFASAALLSFPALAGGNAPSSLSADGMSAIGALPASLLDTLAPGGALGSAATSAAAPGSIEAGSATPSLDAAPDVAEASAMLAGDLGAAPMVADLAQGASPLGAGVPDMLAGMNGGGATMMIGDGMGGSPLGFAGSLGGGGAPRGALLTMSSWSTSW